MTTQFNTRLTPEQEAVISQLTSKYDIDTDQIRFLDEKKPDEPWLSSEVLMSIARQAGGFQSIGEAFDSYIEPLKQVVHAATVVDERGRTFTRTGVATIMEASTNGNEIDEHALAGSRALNAALRAAGFHPLRAGSVVNLDLKIQPSRQPLTDDAASRDTDLKQIHLLAEQKGLIKNVEGGRKEVQAYRTFLIEHWGVRSVVNLNHRERSSVIEAMRQLPDVSTDEDFSL